MLGLKIIHVSKRFPAFPGQLAKILSLNYGRWSGCLRTFLPNILKHFNLAWWRHQIETFSALLVLCAGNSPVTGEFPSQWPVTRRFGIFFDTRVRRNKRLSKQWCCWFEMQSRSLLRHCNGLTKTVFVTQNVYHARTQAWEIPPFCGFWERNTSLFQPKSLILMSNKTPLLKAKRDFIFII